jgi:hypothetical protein
MVEKRKKTTAKTIKQRLKADFNRALNTKVHPDGEAARERLAEMFNGQYKKYEMDTFAYLAFEQMIHATKTKKGDDLEVIFNIQAKA